MAETKSYVGNRDELDPEAIKTLRLERVGQEPENLDVFQRMEKKGVPTAEVLDTHISSSLVPFGTAPTALTFSLLFFARK
uniref:Uncharacterized protein n=1 Tax=Panagrolaimus superbus TaxID=310955 RepID=A0A914YG01_9BILA